MLECIKYTSSEVEPIPELSEQENSSQIAENYE